MTAPAPQATTLNGAAIARIAPFALFIAFLGLADLVSLLARPGVTISAENWISAARGIAVGLLLIAFSRRYMELSGVRHVSIRTWELSAALGLLVFVAWIALDRPFFRAGEPSSGFVPLQQDGTLDVTLVTLRVIGLAAVVPLMEELFWRSFLMRWLTHSRFLCVEPRQVSHSAFLITAVLFALAHDLWLAGFVAGVAYNWIYMRTGNLWAPVAAHAVTNGALAAYVLWTGAWHLW